MNGGDTPASVASRVFKGELRDACRGATSSDLDRLSSIGSNAVRPLLCSELAAELVTVGLPESLTARPCKVRRKADMCCVVVLAGFEEEIGVAQVRIRVAKREIRNF